MPPSDGPDYLHPYIALYDAGTLRTPAYVFELLSLHIEGVRGASTRNGYLYGRVVERERSTYFLTDMSPVKQFRFPTHDRIQARHV